MHSQYPLSWNNFICRISWSSISLLSSQYCILIVFIAFFGLIIVKYFGFCFVMIGVMLMMRIQTLPETPEMSRGKPFLFIFSCMVIVSGVFCFFLEDNWSIKLPPFEKAPIYTVISMALNFCVLFSIVDLSNFILGFC